MHWLAFALALTANATQPCADPHAVSLNVHNYTVSGALREIAAQSKRNIAVDQRVRGRVTVNVHCVPATIALQQVVAQLDAAYCDDGKVIHIGRENGSCPAEWRSPVFERVVRND
jgi:type II secretory pathway component GspD/PulD (secretin)